MQKNKKLLLFSLVQIIAGIACGQTSRTISGVVKDSSAKPIAFATVELYRQISPTNVVKATYTSDKGKFSFSVTNTGAYTVVVSHAGYMDTKRVVTTVTDNTDLGELTLTKAGTQLQGVTVTAKKPLIEQTDDKLIFNVENDPTTKTQNAIDILKKTPFVTVDGDNNVQVNGQSNFKVLLNGRETSMFAQNVKEALKSFPGALITKIEVITSPSAKYDGEGIGGIINIITKKKVAGYNGSINAYYSNNWRNLNANVSAKTGKLGATAYFGGGGSNNVKGSSSTETIPFATAAFTRRLLQGSQLSSNFWDFGNVELNYELDSLTTISAYGNINGGSNKAVLDQTSTVSFASAPDMMSVYDLNSKNEYPTNSVGTDYIKKFSSNKDKEFSIRLNGEFGKSNTFLNSQQDNPPGYDDRYIINDSKATNKQYTVQSDFSQPLKNNKKLDVGIKGIFRRAASDFSSQIKYNPADVFKINPANTDHFNYNQDIYSVYSSYNFKLKKVAIRIGARVEHTEVNGYFASAASTVKQNYTTLLPNVQATIKPNAKFTWVFNYNMRLQRPSIYSLNPFVNNNDSLNISYGNPALNAQTIHSLSVQSRIIAGNTFAGLTLMGSYSNNMIVRYATFDAATGVTSTTSGNYGEEMRIGLSGNVSVKFNTNWSLYVNGNVTYNHVKNKFNTSQTNSGVGGNANLNSSYKLSKRFGASMYAGFWRSPVTIQGTQSLQVWYGLGMDYKMFNEKLSINVSAANFLHKYMDYIYTIKDPQFETRSVTTNPYRGLAVGLNWNFGKLKENVSKKKGESNDDQLSTGN